MRDPKRLNKFYSEMCRIHKKHFCDWRFGQLIINFLNWYTSNKNIDMFFPEEDEMLNYFKEFAGETND